MRKPLFTMLGCVLAACPAPPATAEAATFSAEVGFPETVVISYSATMGERNAVTAEYDVAGRRFVLTDPGANFILHQPISSRALLPPTTTDALRYCTFERRRVTCVFPPAPEPYNDPKYPMPHLRVDLGDGDDTLSMDTEGVAHGGPGADRITSVATEDHLYYYGGAFIHGDDGDDRLVGGIGNDAFTGGAGADTVDGGGGDDGMDYEEEPAEIAALQPPTGGVHVTLDGLANDGHDGGREGDNVLGNVEWLYGTAAADVIVANEGSDFLAGRGGDDRLVGGAGQDEMDGGGGNDRLEARDGEADDYSCGLGVDEVLADPFDTESGFDDGCENVTVEG